MTTRKRLQIGEVRNLAVWTDEGMAGRRGIGEVRRCLHVFFPPVATSCEAKIADFWPWLESALQRYWSHIELVDRLPSITDDVAWIEDAMKDLRERGDRGRLVVRPGHLMPQRAEAFCAYAAHALFGTDLKTSVTIGSISDLMLVLRWALGDAKRFREKHRWRRPRTSDRRDDLFRVIVDRIAHLYRSRTAAREAADQILWSAGVTPVAQSDIDPESARRQRIRADRNGRRAISVTPQ